MTRLRPWSFRGPRESLKVVALVFTGRFPNGCCSLRELKSLHSQGSEICPVLSSRHTLERSGHDRKVAYVAWIDPSGGTVAYIP
jgi:hypothetical protein